MEFHFSSQKRMFQQNRAPSENLDDGKIFTLSLHFSRCDACGLLILLHSHRCSSVWSHFLQPSENLDAGEIFAFRPPLSECDSGGPFRTPHSNRQAPMKSSKSTQRCIENRNLQSLKRSRDSWVPFKTSTRRLCGFRGTVDFPFELTCFDVPASGDIFYSPPKT